MRSTDAGVKRPYKPRKPWRKKPPEDWKERVRNAIRAKAPKEHALKSGWCRGDFIISCKNVAIPRGGIQGDKI